VWHALLGPLLVLATGHAAATERLMLPRPGEEPREVIGR
jgi:hypothetical protein